MVMVDVVLGLIKEGEHVIQISVNFHVLTLNFQLFSQTHIFSSLLLYWKLVRTINFKVRRAIISSSI
jgi:hypothetical protein